METRAWIMDAFTDVPFTGNRAGVVPEANHLSREQMQAIAGEIYASETAFLTRPTDPNLADYRIFYFTPESEVDLCGHATIATVAGLLIYGKLSAAGEGICRLETNVGILPIRYHLDNGKPWVEMQQASPQFRDTTWSDTFMADLLGISPNDLDPNLPSGVSYTGLWDAFVGVRSLAVMERLAPRLSDMAKWNREMGVTSTHVYTTETVDKQHHFHARDFSPAVGVPEDPCTGTATGALLALLVDRGFCKAGQAYHFEQGYEIRRAGVLTSRLERTDKSDLVFVGGTAVCSMDAKVYL